MQETTIEKRTCIEAAIMAAVLYATARELPGITIHDASNKLHEMIDVLGIRNWKEHVTYNLGVQRVAGEWYSVPFDQFITSFIFKHHAVLNSETRKVMLCTKGIDECVSIISSFLQENEIDNEDHQHAQFLLDQLGININTA